FGPSATPPTPADPGPSMEQRAQEALKNSGAPAIPAPLPGVAPAVPRSATVAKPKPLQIPSLATGIKAKGLSDVMTEAENLMKTGKFATALDQYDLAEQIDPGNPMVLLGRANAELGASYYSRAEAHLRQALTADPSLLMGQYDLKSWLGDDRLAFLVKDLKEIAQSDPKQARPVFLLSYIAYNTGNERRAAAYLDLAEKRAGNDPFYKVLREHWSLPDDVTGTEEMNK
ncbi:MAG: tetratricopeptide repeat protein, partial [Tepidisphaeraceae bacterium]